MEYANRYFEEVQVIAKTINLKTIEKMVKIIESVKEQKGRLFFIGVGGSAANCTHAVNDFRKIGGIECYTPNDNVAELTARTNDEGRDTEYGYGAIRNPSSQRIFYILMYEFSDIPK